jgi:hypothetical protein
LIAEEPFGKDSSRSGGESAVTAVTVTLLQFISNDLLAHRIHFNNGTWFTALGVQRAAAVGALLQPRHRLLTRDLMIGNVAAAMTAMTGLGAAPALRAFRCRVGFEGNFGGGSRGAEGAFLGGPFLVAQPGFEANDFFLQPVNDQLFFQTLWTIGQVEFRRV